MPHAASPRAATTTGARTHARSVLPALCIALHGHKAQKANNTTHEAREATNQPPCSCRPGGHGLAPHPHPHPHALLPRPHWQRPLPAPAPAAQARPRWVGAACQRGRPGPTRVTAPPKPRSPACHVSACMGQEQAAAAAAATHQSCRVLLMGCPPRTAPRCCRHRLPLLARATAAACCPGPGPGPGSQAASPLQGRPAPQPLLPSLRCAPLLS